MSDGEAKADQSLQSGLASAEKDAGATSATTASGIFDIAAVLEALAKTCGRAGPAKSSITDQSLRDLARYLMEHDPSSQLFVPLAEEFCSRNLWQEAVETCRRGLAFHPRQFRVRVLLGWALWELGNAEEAEKLLTEARKELEKSAVIYEILARAAENRGNSAQAWRLMHIYQSLHESGQRQTVEQADVPTVAPAEPKANRDSLLVRLLSNWMINLANKQARAVSDLQIFSDADRRLIAAIVGAGKP